MFDEKVGIAGTGRMATALGRALSERGVDIACVAGRQRSVSLAVAAFLGPGTRAVEYSKLPSYCSRILIAVSDSAIESVAKILAGGGASGKTVLHTCGAKGADALSVLTERGASCGTLHPLQTIGEGQGSEALTGIWFAVSGDAKAVDWAAEIVSLLEGHILRIQPDCQPLYHAAASMASNYVTTLLDVAQDLLIAAGVERQDAIRALAPLARTSVENAVSQGTAAALTGPIARGDAGTVALHLQALQNREARVRHLYRVAGLNALAIAERRGLDPAKAAAVADALKNQD